MSKVPLHLPDVRDGLTRAERVILWQLDVLQKERGDRNVPTAMLYGRVVEHVDISVHTFQKLLQRMVGGPLTGATSDEPQTFQRGRYAASGPRQSDARRATDKERACRVRRPAR